MVLGAARAVRLGVPFAGKGEGVGGAEMGAIGIMGIMLQKQDPVICGQRVSPRCEFPEHAVFQRSRERFFLRGGMEGI